MTISDISIRKPVFAWMLMLGLIVFGLICFKGLGISQLPDVDFPVLTISTTWTGAAPETIEAAVTDVIEDAVMSVAGIRSVGSTCQEGLTTTSLEFELNVDINVALQEVQSKISQAQKRLPKDVELPIVNKANPEDQPIMWAALTGPNSLRDKVLFVRDHLKNSITTVSGVGDVRLGGFVDPNMRIWLSNEEMRRREIAVEDIKGAIESGTSLTPAGYFDDGLKETNLRVMSEARTPEEFRNLIIPSRSGAPVWRMVKVGEVAKIEEGLADVRRISRFKGEPAIGIGIVKQRGANAVAVGDAVKKRLAELRELLPDGMSINLVVDSTRFIKESTQELLFTLSMAALLTAIVCFLFLGSFSSAINVVLAIPTSLIGTFIFMKWLGFTLNTFTLLALSLSIGIVVDDAIMVLENIVRHFEAGKSRIQASLLGAREITGAAVASTLAILAIFLPVVFMEGVIGKFFYQFGLAMSIAVALSLLEAMTLAPMRCSQFLRSGKETRMGRWMDKKMTALADRYRRGLEWCLGHRLAVMAGAFLIFAAPLALFKGITKELSPSQDQSQFMVNVQTPMGSSIEVTDKVFTKLEALLKTRPEVDSYYVAIGGFQGGIVNQGISFIVLKPPKERGVHPPFKRAATQEDIMGWVRTSFSKVEGVTRATVMDLSKQAFGAHRGYPVTFSVQGPDWDVLASSAEKMMERMRNSGLMTDVDSDYKPNMPELRIVPDRVRAAARGVGVSHIADTITALVSSLPVAKYTDTSGHRDDIRLKLEGAYTRNKEDFKRIWVRNIHGEMIPLHELVDFEDKPSLLTIGRLNRERAISVYANLPPGQDQGKAMAFVEAAAKEILPPGYHAVASGSSKTFSETGRSLLIAFVLGIFVAYMVLGAQFNSFIHPVTVLLALPFSLTGAVISLWLTGISLNMFSMIGILLLMGIVKKNSILLVEFTNQVREKGERDVHRALLVACPTRLRPILMTSVATVVAAIPSSLALGPGAETIRPMAVVVIGGVMLSTVLTLFVVPCAYSLFSKVENKKRHLELERALVSDAGREGLNSPAIPRSAEM
jgi:hydrophobe/amphiphile efflux-1 (HAE1) family protein